MYGWGGEGGGAGRLMNGSLLSRMTPVWAPLCVVCVGGNSTDYLCMAVQY